LVILHRFLFFFSIQVLELQRFKKKENRFCFSALTVSHPFEFRLSCLAFYGSINNFLGCRKKLRKQQQQQQQQQKQ
jgi:hypothetical protein